ncbi:hypothetical protein B0T17DRAFT_120256 [Bombardia bombarda]|uniref:Cytochrome b5 heme-binding domain-containing protein n=1 Tax=Bombardia bombarda TaxID=252184 RepID=A0AA39T163_9PEZI|nr:hypothetical protein B0T17DRAFT_120256 [Bombardia bombarda]
MTTTVYFSGNRGAVGQDVPPNVAPATPLRERYGGWVDWPAVLHGYSGFAPVLPSSEDRLLGLDVTKEDLVQKEIQPAPLSDGQADWLLRAERFQINQICGIKTWQIPAMHVRVAEDPTVVVDENSWHPVFQPRHWLDLDFPLGDTLDPGRTWSLDDEDLWAELRQVIEMANRIFTMLRQTRWFHSLMMVKPAQQDVMSHIPYDKRGPGVQDPNHPPHRIWAQGNPPTAQEIEQAYQASLELGKWITWSFVDPKNPHGNDFDDSMNMNLYGITDFQSNANYQYNPQHASPTFANCRISGQLLRNLFIDDPLGLQDTRTRKVERQLSRFIVAAIMIHELMHAFNGIQTKLHAGRYPNPTIIEPFINEEFIAEIGYSAENAVFGGVFSIAPNYINNMKISEPFDFGQRFYMIFQQDWCENNSQVPADIELTDEDTAIEFGRHMYYDINNPWLWHRYPVPTLYTSLFDLEDFWNNIVNRFGMSALRPPHYLKTLHRLPSGEIRIYSAKENPSAGWAVDGSWNGYPDSAVDTVLREQVEELQFRKQVWNRLRPWYGAYYQRWQLSPHSMMAHRTNISVIGHAIRNKDLKGASLYFGRLKRCVRLFNSQPDKLKASQGIWTILMHMVTIAMPWEPTKTDHVEKAATTYTIPQVYSPSNRSNMDHGGPHVQLEADHAGDLDERKWVSGGHVPPEFRAMTPTAARIAMLDRAFSTLMNYSWAVPMPGGLYEAVFDLANSLRDQLDNHVGQCTGWLDWNFDFPEYQAQKFLLPANQMIGPQPVPDNHPNIPDPFLYMASPPPSPDRQVQFGPGYNFGINQDQLPRGLGPAARMAQVGRAIFRTKDGGSPSTDRPESALPRRVVPTRYWTVAEVADHESAERRWGLVDDGFAGYDVYDVTDVQLDFDNLDKYFDKMEHGMVIKGEGLIQELDDRREGQRIGKLLLPLELPDIVENDGKNGRPLWVYLGPEVYDVTKFPFASSIERDLFRKAPLRNIGIPMVELGMDVIKMRDQLKPYRCATVKQMRSKNPQRRQQAFTMETVNRHIFKEIGLWTVIDGYVYDLSSYVDNHPGGISIINLYAGRDSTESFKNSHENWERYLKDFEHLKLGHVVPEISAKDKIGPDEIVYQHFKYRPSILAEYEPTREVFLQLNPELRPYYGQDVTNLPHSQAVFTLSTYHSQTAVGHIRRPPHREIGLEELAEHAELVRSSGLGPMPEFQEDPERPGYTTNDKLWWMMGSEIEHKNIWVTVNGWVYDVSDIVLYADSSVSARLKMCGGGECTDKEIANVLENDNIAKCLGRVVLSKRMETGKPLTEEQMRRSAELEKRERHEIIDSYRKDNTRHTCGTINARKQYAKRLQREEARKRQQKANGYETDENDLQEALRRQANHQATARVWAEVRSRDPDGTNTIDWEKFGELTSKLPKEEREKMEKWRKMKQPLLERQRQKKEQKRAADNAYTKKTPPEPRLSTSMMSSTSPDLGRSWIGARDVFPGTKRPAEGEVEVEEERAPKTKKVKTDKGKGEDKAIRKESRYG